MLRIYGDSISGNCHKVKWTADYLGLPYRWIETSVLNGETRTLAFLAMNPAGQVPLVILADGRPLAQSNAIILHLAEGSSLIPEDAYLRAKMLEWLFWEQYSHEPYVAVARFQVKYLGHAAVSLEPKLVERAYGALARLEAATSSSAFLVGDQCTLADVSLVAYTRLAHEGGMDLERYPAVVAWIGRVETAMNIRDLIRRDQTRTDKIAAMQAFVTEGIESRVSEGAMREVLAEARRKIKPCDGT